jgi:hypothetical protein
MASMFASAQHQEHEFPAACEELTVVVDLPARLETVVRHQHVHAAGHQVAGRRTAVPFRLDDSGAEKIDGVMERREPLEPFAQMGDVFGLAVTEPSLPLRVVGVIVSGPRQAG